MYDKERMTGKLVSIAGFIKTTLFCHFLPKYDEVVWLDADLVVTNPSISLADLWKTATHHVNQNNRILMPFDWNSFNATVISAKSCKLTIDFMWCLENTGRGFFMGDPWKEMNAARFFSALPPYDEMIAYSSIKNLCPVHRGAYVPYVPEHVSSGYEWDKGDFSVHLSALSLERRIELARRYQQEIYGTT